MNPEPLRVLVFSKVYPNEAQPYFGVFVETRLRKLVERHPDVRPVVVAPVPWFPFRSRIFGKYATFAHVPKDEERNGIRVLHPRYLHLPKLWLLAPWLMRISVHRTLRLLARDPATRFELIDAHFFFPDGVAAVMLGKSFRVPVCVTARGTDINLMPRWRMSRMMIRWAARRAAQCIAVSRALREQLEALEPTAHCQVLRNGVDLDFFAPHPERDELRETMHFRRFTLVSVANLTALKGIDLVIEAVASLPDVDLCLIGDGEEEHALRRKVESLGLKSRVRFLGSMNQDKLHRYYQAADGLVLASSREGWPNVVLESMACGTPVIATRVGATPEAIAQGVSGVLLDERSASAVASAIDVLRTAGLDRGEVRRWAENFSWAETSDGLFRVFNRLCRRS